MRVQGRVAIVTGAQQGIGAAVAGAVGRDGAVVVVNWLDDGPGAEAVVAAIEADGGSAVAVRADVADPAGVASLVDAASEFGGVDLLVNNAGIFPRSGFLDLELEEWDRVLGVNLRGAFVCSQAVARDMVDRGSRGSIVNISSAVAAIGSSRGAHYTASKSGLLGLTRASALALAPHGIRVNAVAAGMVDTAQPRDGLTEEQIDAIVSGFPLGRLVTPAELAAAVVFLASDDAEQITGQTLHVNGGAFMP
jgi:3-oxoacyl-[acyl-carrier protein] reductase